MVGVAWPAGPDQRLFHRQVVVLVFVYLPTGIENTPFQFQSPKSPTPAGQIRVSCLLHRPVQFAESVGGACDGVPVRLLGRAIAAEEDGRQRRRLRIAQASGSHLTCCAVAPQTRKSLVSFSPIRIPILFLPFALADPVPSVPDCRCTSPYAPRWPSLRSALTSTSSSTSEAPSRPSDAWSPSPTSSPCPPHRTRRGTASPCSWLPRSFKAPPLARSSTLLLTSIRGRSSPSSFILSIIHYSLGLSTLLILNDIVLFVPQFPIHFLSAWSS